MPEDASAGGGESTPTAAPPSTGQEQTSADRPSDLETAEPEPKAHDLPGVLSTAGDGGDDAALKELLGPDPDLEEEEEPRKGKGGERARGPDGRFLKEGEGESQPEGESPKKPGSEDEPKSAPEQFEFGGEKWESQEKAEQSFRTLRGQYKSMEARASRSDENWQAYKAWEQYAEGLARELEDLKARGARGGGSPQPGSGAGTGEATGEKPAALNIDWDAYEYIAQKGTPRQAGEYLVAQINEFYQKSVIPGEVGKLREEMEQRLRPSEEAQQLNQTADEMSALTTQMASYKTPDGRDAFPELKDAQAVFQIGQAWRQLAERDGADLNSRLQMLRSAGGLAQAVAYYRLLRDIETPPVTSTASSGGETELPDSPVSPGAAATVEAGGREGFVPGARTDRSSAELDLVAGLGDSRIVDDDLGFARNRSARR